MKNAERTVVICGAYGMENAGDDAVLRSIVAALREFDADADIGVIGRRPKKIAAENRVKAAGRLQIFKWLGWLRRGGLFILGGGSLLQDVTSLRSLWYYELVTRLARKCGSAVMLYGSGIGPVRRERQRKRCARLLNECAEVICLRDEKSARTAADWGVTEPRMVAAADPVFRLNLPGGEREKSLGFVLRPWPGLEGKLDAVASAARYGYEEYGLTPVFLSFAPGDLGPAREVMARLEGIPYRVYADPRSAGRMSAVVSMRLHGLIFALLGGTGCAGLSYDPKVSDFCRENGLPCSLLGDVSAKGLRGLIDRALAADAEALHQQREELRKKERRNGEAAWELLAR